MKKKLLKNVLIACSVVFMLCISAPVLTSCDDLESEPLPIPEKQLQPIKDDGIQELEEYVKYADYRQKEQEEITQILKTAGDEINEASNEEEVKNIIALTKEKLDALKTNLEYQLEEQAESLATAKLEKKNDINACFEQFSEENYRKEQWEEILNHINQAIQEIDSMTSIEEVEGFDIAIVKEKIDSIKTNAILLQEELETAKNQKLNELTGIYEQYSEQRYSANTLSNLDTIYNETIEKIQNCTMKEEVAGIILIGESSVESQMMALPLAIAGRGNVYFDSLTEALAYHSIETLSFYDNISCDIVIPENMNIVLDLNGYTLTNTNNHTIDNAGTLIIKDTSSQKTGTVDNLTHQKAAIVNQVSGQLTIESGNFTRSLENGQSSKDNGGNSYYVIQNFGRMVIKAGTISQDGHYSSMIANGWYNGQQNTTKASAELIIENGIFSGGLNTIKNDDYGITTIKNGTFTNFSQAAVFNVNQLIIEGGVIDGTNAAQAIYTRWYNTGYDLGQTTIHETAVIKGKITGVDAYYNIHENNTSVNEVFLSMSDGWALINALKDQKGARLPEHDNFKLSIKLLKDIALPKEGYIFNRKYLDLDLNGKALSLAYEEGQKRVNYGTLVIAQSIVTINDSSTAQTGKIINTDTTGGKLTTTNDYNYAIRVGKNGDLTINAGYYYSSANSSGVGSSCIYIYNSSNNYSAKVTINGGVFATEKDYEGTYFVLNVDNTNNYNSQYIVNAGTFINYKPGTTNTGSKDVVIVKEEAKIIEEVIEGNTYYTVQ